MLPFGETPGRYIFKWKKAVWLGMFIIAIALFYGWLMKFIPHQIYYLFGIMGLVVTILIYHQLRRDRVPILSAAKIEKRRKRREAELARELREFEEDDEDTGEAPKVESKKIRAGDGDRDAVDGGEGKKKDEAKGEGKETGEPAPPGDDTDAAGPPEPGDPEELAGPESIPALPEGTGGDTTVDDELDGIFEEPPAPAPPGDAVPAEEGAQPFGSIDDIEEVQPFGSIDDDEAPEDGAEDAQGSEVVSGDVSGTGPEDDAHGPEIVSDDAPGIGTGDEFNIGLDDASTKEEAANDPGKVEGTVEVTDTGEAAGVDPGTDEGIEDDLDLDDIGLPEEDETLPAPPPDM